MPAVPNDIRKKKSPSVATLHALLVTAEELEWLVRNTSRRLAKAAETGRDPRKDKTGRVIMQLDEKLSMLVGTGQGPFELMTSRDELVVLRTIVAAQHDGLIQQVLPAYIARGLTASPRYGEAISQAQLLEQFGNKIANVYNNGQKRRNSDYGKRTKKRSDG
jgi:hypothetical protein